MSYEAQVPGYVVILPCSHRFRSQTPVEAYIGDPDPEDPTQTGDLDGLAWLYCRDSACSRWYCLEGWELAQYQYVPRDSLGRRISDKRIAAMLDAARVRDRIAGVLRSTGGVVPCAVIADNLGVSVDTVWAVAADLGTFTRDTDQGENAA